MFSMSPSAANQGRWTGRAWRFGKQAWWQWDANLSNVASPNDTCNSKSPSSCKTLTTVPIYNRSETLRLFKSKSPNISQSIRLTPLSPVYSSSISSRVLGPTVTPLEVTLRQAYRRLYPLNADGKVLRLLCPSCEPIPKHVFFFKMFFESECPQNHDSTFHYIVVQSYKIMCNKKVLCSLMVHKYWIVNVSVAKWQAAPLLSMNLTP